MTKKYLLDTDVLIDYLRGLSVAGNFLEKIMTDTAPYLSTITVAELYAGIKEGKERQLLETFLNVFEVINVDRQIACTGGLYRRDYGKSHGVGLADAMIAATAESVGAHMVTLNKKHFPMLKNVLVPYTKEK
jgi:hypothetical protein